MAGPDGRLIEITVPSHAEAGTTLTVVVDGTDDAVDVDGPPRYSAKLTSDTAPSSNPSFPGASRRSSPDPVVADPTSYPRTVREIEDNFISKTQSESGDDDGERDEVGGEDDDAGGSSGGCGGGGGPAAGAAGGGAAGADGAAGGGSSGGGGIGKGGNSHPQGLGGGNVPAGNTAHNRTEPDPPPPAGTTVLSPPEAASLLASPPRGGIAMGSTTSLQPSMPVPMSLSAPVSPSVRLAHFAASIERTLPKTGRELEQQIHTIFGST